MFVIAAATVVGVGDDGNHVFDGLGVAIISWNLKFAFLSRIIPEKCNRMTKIKKLFEFTWN